MQKAPPPPLPPPPPPPPGAWKSNGNCVDAPDFVVMSTFVDSCATKTVPCNPPCAAFFFCYPLLRLRLPMLLLQLLLPLPLLHLLIGSSSLCRWDGNINNDPMGCGMGFGNCAALAASGGCLDSEPASFRKFTKMYCCASCKVSPMPKAFCKDASVAEVNAKVKVEFAKKGLYVKNEAEKAVAGGCMQLSDSCFEGCRDGFGGEYGNCTEADAKLKKSTEGKQSCPMPHVTTQRPSD